MAFTVESGSIIANANSYVSIAEANTYFIDRGSPVEWDSAYESDRKAALIYATTWLDQNISWNSSIQDLDQTLGWPRINFFDREGRTIGGTGVIPTLVKNATCELALQWLREDFTSSVNEGVKSESIGNTSITYATSRTNKNYTFIKSTLKDYGSTGYGNVAVTYRA